MAPRRPGEGMVDRMPFIAGLGIAFTALVLQPVIADGLDQFALLVVAVLVATGLGLVWRALPA